MTLYVSTDKGGFSRSEILKILGWWPVSVGDVLRSLSLVALLFAGPLFETGVIEGRWRQWVTGRALAGVLTSSVGWRNYVAVSPLSLAVFGPAFSILNQSLSHLMHARVTSNL